MTVTDEEMTSDFDLASFLKSLLRPAVFHCSTELYRIDNLTETRES
jgi:hypothetical protein